MKKLSIIILAFLAFSTGCIKDEFDVPPTALDPDYTVTHTIAELKAMVTGGPLLITDDVIVKGTVTGNDLTGNIYKNLFIEDASAAIAISANVVEMNTEYQIGREVYVLMKDLYIGSYANLPSIGAAPSGAFPEDVGRIEENIFRDQVVPGLFVGERSPELITLDQVSDNLLNKLVLVENAEFDEDDINSTYGNIGGTSGVNRTVNDCNGNDIVVRCSDFADFTGNEIPNGNGTIKGILTIFNTTYQLALVTDADVDMEGVRCDGSSPNQIIVLQKDFEDQSINSGGWTTEVPLGTFTWETSDQGGGQQGDFYAKMSNFNGGNTASEAWLISPDLDLSGLTNPSISFINAFNFTGDALEVLISTDYDGGQDPNTSTWVDLNPILSAGGWDWVSSGNIDLSAYDQSGVFIAFKYAGSDSDGSTWEVDNVVITAEP